MDDSTTVEWLLTAVGQATRSASFCAVGCLPDHLDPVLVRRTHLNRALDLDDPSGRVAAQLFFRGISVDLDQRGEVDPRSERAGHRR